MVVDPIKNREGKKKVLFVVKQDRVIQRIPFGFAPIAGIGDLRKERNRGAQKRYEEDQTVNFHNLFF